ncbi:MAG TPA: hypothetical protein VFE96_09985 [Candidatus Bathyarchaeia archaeon]|nr:hypothetical protein [Candidatus Bathyarchaeia archaeon]
MVSHETKRVLGIVGLLFILVLLAARTLPSPFYGSTVIHPSVRASNGSAPVLIFDHNIMFLTSPVSFNLSLTGSHSLKWLFNVTRGSVTANLTDATGSLVWTVGARSEGLYRLNGTGVASFNWTAPASGYYLLTLENQFSSGSTWSGQYLSPFSSCEVRVWDLNESGILRVVFL